MTLGIQVKIDGQAFDGYTSINVQRGFRDVAGHFEMNIALTSDNGQPTELDYPIKIGDTCSIAVEGVDFLEGFVETSNVRIAGQELSISFGGRDRTADLIDSTISVREVAGFLGNITLEKMCENVISGLGITNISVVDRAFTSTFAEQAAAQSANPFQLTNTPAAFGKNEFIMPTNGETSIEFLQKAADLRGLFLNTDGMGNLVITRGGLPTDTIVTKLLLEINGSNNNILTSNSSIDYSKRYHHYVAYTQLAASQQALSDKQPDSSDMFSVRSTLGTATDDDVRDTRIYNFTVDMPLDIQDLARRAVWENALRRSGSIKYSCTLQGFTYNGTNIWEPNQLINLSDDYARIRANMLIDRVKFTQDMNGALITELELVDANSYVIQADLLKQQTQGQTINQGLLSDD
jgi:prophage tail gpP-like protein